MLTKQEHWTITQAEAESTAKAVGNVARHYPSIAGHEKLVDWVMLIQTIGFVYGSRIYLSMPEKKQPPPTGQPVASPSGGVHLFPMGA